MTKLHIMAVILLVSIGQASAHTALATSFPANASTLDKIPEALMLEFTEPVRLLRLEMFRAENSSNENINLEFEATPNSLSTYSIPLRALNAGNYQVNWAVMGADSHMVQGTIEFGIGPQVETNHAPSHASQAHEHETNAHVGH